jgi:hypothetical protein
MSTIEIVPAGQIRSGDTIAGDGDALVLRATDHGVEMGFVFKDELDGTTWCRYLSHDVPLHRRIPTP